MAPRERLGHDFTSKNVLYIVFTGMTAPERALLREIILSEEDSLEPSEFVAKMQIWLKLFSAESRC